MNDIWQKVRIEYSSLRYWNKIFRLIAIFILISVSIFAIWLLFKSNSMALKSSADWFNWAIGFFTFYLAIITFSIIWWQGWRLKKQLELQVITDLYKEWNSDKIRERRSDFCSILSIDGIITDNSDDGLDKVESVMEFLERIASYHMNGVLSIGLIWDTFSFYIMRYYFYSHNTIDKINKRWSNDDTLYYDLTKLYKKLIKLESRRRWLTRVKIEEGFKKETKIFKKSEDYMKNPEKCKPENSQI